MFPQHLWSHGNCFRKLICGRILTQAFTNLHARTLARMELLGVALLFNAITYKSDAGYTSNVLPRRRASCILHQDRLHALTVAPVILYSCSHLQGHSLVSFPFLFVLQMHWLCNHSHHWYIRVNLDTLGNSLTVMTLAHRRDSRSEESDSSAHNTFWTCFVNLVFRIVLPLDVFLGLFLSFRFLPAIY